MPNTRNWPISWISVETAVGVPDSSVSYATWYHLEYFLWPAAIFCEYTCCTIRVIIRDDRLFYKQVMFKTCNLVSFSVTRESDTGRINPFPDRYHRPSGVHFEICGPRHHCTCHISHRYLLDESYNKICESSLGNLIYVSDNMYRPLSRLQAIIIFYFKIVYINFPLVLSYRFLFKLISHLISVP